MAVAGLISECEYNDALQLSSAWVMHDQAHITRIARTHARSAGSLAPRSDRWPSASVCCAISD